MTNYLIFLGIIYLIPIIALILFPIKKFIKPVAPLALLGRIEWILAIFRDTFFAAAILVFCIYQIYLFANTSQQIHIYFAVASLAGALLSLFAYLNRKIGTKQFLNFIYKFDLIDPSEFFSMYYSVTTGIPGKMPVSLKKQLTLPLDYKSYKTFFGPVITGLINTGSMARLVVKSSKMLSGEMCRKIADVMGAVWGARILQVCGAEFSINGLDKIENLKGRSIFVANHKSFVDFVIIPLSIGFVNFSRKEKFRPRYMAARDHFLDNPILYRFLGLGRALEAIGTIFVDRKSRKELPTESVNEAANAIAEDGIDVVIFPQGTRAYSTCDKFGKRVDAGYYTTGMPEKLLLPHGHIKKGAAYLAVDATSLLSKRGESLNVIPVGLKGTATLCPKGKLKIEKGAALTVTFGEPMTLKKDSETHMTIKHGQESDYSGHRKEMVGEVFVKIDDMLKNVLNIHNELQKRLILDIRHMIREDEINMFLQAIDAWKIDQDLIYSTLDCIYSCPKENWRPFIKRLSGLLIETSTPKEDIIAFKKVVVAEMMR